MIPDLRGPTDPDNYRVKTGRFGERFYTDPLPADLVWPETSDDDVHPAVSTVKKATGQDWSKAMAKRLAKDPSQLVAIGKIESEFERKQRINLLSDAGLDGASGRGTIVHAHAEAMLTNRIPIYQMSDAVKPFIRTLDAFLAAYQPKLVAAECVAMHRSLNSHNIERGRFAGYGGTLDAVVEIEGKLYLVDWKSRAEDSEHKAYPEEGAQVAAYGRADYWIVGADNVNGAERIAPPKLDGGLIVSIKPDSYECYPIDLDKGFDYWTDLHAWWQARRSETKSIGRKWAPRAATSSLVVIPETVSFDESKTCSAYPACVESAGCNPAVRCDGHGAECDQTPATLCPATGENCACPEEDLCPADGTPSRSTIVPTVKGNRARFDALDTIRQSAAREAFRRAGVDPRRAATAARVSGILTTIEQRPTIGEMQEQIAADKAERREAGVSATPIFKLDMDDLLAAEGGEATDEMIGEARLMFDMVIGDNGRGWTGWRVKEATAAGLSIKLSDLRSVKRAHLYLALCRWAGWRGETLEADEVEDNIEFTVLLNMVSAEHGGETLGLRLASLTTEQAEQFAKLVEEVVESETGDEVVTEPEVNPQSTQTETEE